MNSLSINALKNAIYCVAREMERTTRLVETLSPEEDDDEQQLSEFALELQQVIGELSSEYMAAREEQSPYPTIEALLSAASDFGDGESSTMEGKE
jgi:hypothetical protein